VAAKVRKVRSKKNACCVRAFRYRKLGIPLKVFPRSSSSCPTAASWLGTRRRCSRRAALGMTRMTVLTGCAAGLMPRDGQW
jgi:hypothetical protein